MDDERGLDQMEWSEDGQLLAVSTTKGIFQTKGVSTLILNWGLISLAIFLPIMYAVTRN
jgi:hypothetical protein